MNKKVACPLPFVHPFFDVRGRYNVCCNGTLQPEGKHITEMSAEEWFHGPIMDKVRSDMIDGTRNPWCDHCWKKDDIGIESPRYHYMRVWEDKDVDYNNPLPRYFDLKPSNHCNLACIFCTPSSSDKIERITESLPVEDQPDRWRGGIEYTKKLEHKETFDPAVVDYIIEHVEDLEILKFTGGEPFLIDSVLDIIKTVSDMNPDILLMMTSNGTAVPKDFYPVLNKLSNVKIKLSIDAVDELYSYIRYPSKWEAYQDRLENLLSSLPHVHFDINCLITNMNLEQLPKIRNWYHSLASRYHNLEYLTIDPNLTPESNESSLYMMPVEYLTRIKEWLVISTSDWDMDNPIDKQIDNVYKKINDAVNRNLFFKDKNIDRFRKEFIRQDKIRNRNIVDLVDPITQEFFNKYI